jgi:hypothetical protein
VSPSDYQRKGNPDDRWSQKEQGGFPWIITALMLWMTLAHSQKAAFVVAKVRYNGRIHSMGSADECADE